MTLPASRGEHFRFDMLSLGMTASGHMVGDVSCSLSGSIFDSIRTGATLSWSGDDDLMPDWRHSLIRPMYVVCLLYTSPSPRDRTRSRMPSSA